MKANKYNASKEKKLKLKTKETKRTITLKTKKLVELKGLNLQDMVIGKKMVDAQIFRIICQN